MTDFLFDLSICIVNWNNVDLLRDCLNSIFDRTWQISLEVIVVDNASTDNSVAMVQTEFPGVKLIVSNQNSGYAQTNNQAFDLAEGRYLLLLNNDTVILPGSFDVLVQFMDTHAEAGMVGCKLLNLDGSLQRSCWRQFPALQAAIVDAFYLWRLTPWLSWVRASEISEANLQDTLEVAQLLGACMLVRWEVINQVGGMDPTIFLFLSDTEWCYRIKKSGWKIYFLPSAEIIHIGQQSVHRNPAQTLPEKYRSYMWFYRKHKNPSKIQEIFLKFIIVLAGLLRIGLWTWRSRTPNQRSLAHRMRYGYWQVVKQSFSF